MGESSAPVRFVESAGCENKSIAMSFSNALESIGIILFNQAAESTEFGRLVKSELIGCHIRHFHQHAANEVYAFQLRQVDLEMEWNLALFLFSFLLRSLLVVLSQLLAD